MNRGRLRVLIVEDNPMDAELLEIQLSNGGYDSEIRRVQSASEMREALESAEWDLVLSDYMMPRFTGLQALELLKASGKDIPFILISGSAADDVAVSAMRAGAQDFFTKGSLALLVSAIRRELREAERRAVARAQREQLYQHEKLAALGTLMAGIAHELNNPLAVIMSQASLLQAALEGDPRRRRADSILSAVNSCSRIVKNFLALARHEPPQRVAVSVNDIVHAALDLVGYGLRTDAVEVVLDLADPLPPVEGDPQQLETVVINLVSNAHYALRSCTGKRKVTIRTRVDTAEGRVLLFISDNGSGIPPDIRRRIFDPFFTTKPPGQGTGLGLSLCHGIISSHEGTIAVTDNQERGTTFLITLPIASASSTARQPLVNVQPQAVASRILVVDDDPAVAAGFYEILSAQGHDVDVELTSRAALQRILTGAYAVVMTDMRMPDLDGPALYQEVINRRPSLAKSFLFVTGDTFSPPTDRFLKETGAVHLAKPCTFDEVEEAVARTLSRRGAVSVEE
jgi:signal transduction histidine kinase